MLRCLFLLFTLLCLINTATFAAFPVTEYSPTEIFSTANNIDLVEPHLEAPINEGSSVCGILSFIFSMLGLAAWLLALTGYYEVVFLTIPLGIAAIVLGAIGFNKRLKGLAITGFILGILEIVLWLVMIFAVYVLGSGWN